MFIVQYISTIYPYYPLHDTNEAVTVATVTSNKAITATAEVTKSTAVTLSTANSADLDLHLTGLKTLSIIVILMKHLWFIWCQV